MGVTMMMFRIMTIFFASICTISGKVLQFPRREGQLQCGYLETSTGILQRTKRQFNINFTPFCSNNACLAQRAVGKGLLGAAFGLALLNNRRGKREDVSQENICHFLQIDDDQIFTESNCYRIGSSSIRISPSAEFNVTKVLGFPDDNTLLIDLDRSLPQDLVDKCIF